MPLRPIKAILVHWFTGVALITMYRRVFHESITSAGVNYFEMYKYIIFFKCNLLHVGLREITLTNVHFYYFGFILMHDLFFSSVSFYSVFLCLGMWGLTPKQSFTFKGHDHNFVPVLFFYFYCVQCFRNTLLAINLNLNVSRRVISNI